MVEASGLTFRAGWMIALALLIPLAAILFFRTERLRRDLAERFVAARMRGGDRRARRVRPILLTTSLLAIILASSGPRHGYSLRSIPGDDTFRVIILDTSESMAAEDVGTSRFVAARAIARQLIESSSGRVGLIVFEREADIISPLTSDLGALRVLLDSVSTGQMSEAGSDLGKALLKGVSLVEKLDRRGVDFVIISDGEDQGHSLSNAIRKLREEQIPVSAVAIGNREGATIPTPDGPLRDQSGETVRTAADPERMSRIAKSTGGRLYVNPFAAASLDGLINATASAQRTEDRQVRVPTERYQWPLSIGLALAFVASFLHRGAE